MVVSCVSFDVDVPRQRYAHDMWSIVRLYYTYYARVEHDICACSLLLEEFRKDKYNTTVHRSTECAYAHLGGIIAMLEHVPGYM
jgi:hypothetical protein